MIKIQVSLENNSYPIFIGNKILPSLGGQLKRLALGKDAIIITNPVIGKWHGANIVSSLKKAGFHIKTIEVPEGEKCKSMETANRVLNQIARYDVMKRVFIISFGGGVVGDLAGYVAAVYKRGIPYIQVPTTFLAQIDSAIGGKVGIDLAVGKNLVGAFYQPRMVYSDINVLTTLGARQIRNGFAEAVKYGVICSPKLFNQIEKGYKNVFNFDTRLLTDVVLECSRIKADIVQKDERETKSIRTVLNFGHTIGHAIEAAGKFNLYQHGEAIALGMRAAASISRKVLRFSEQDERRLNQILTNIGLPEKINTVSTQTILLLMRHDKKFIFGRNRFVLTNKIGQVRVVEDIPWKVIENSIAALRK